MKAEWLTWDGAKIVRVPEADVYEAFIRITITGPEVYDIKLRLSDALPAFKDKIKYVLGELKYE